MSLIAATKDSTEVSNERPVYIVMFRVCSAAHKVHILLLPICLFGLDNH